MSNNFVLWIGSLMLILILGLKYRQWRRDQRDPNPRTGDFVAIEKTQFQIDCQEALDRFLKDRGLTLDEIEEGEVVGSYGSGPYVLIRARVKNCSIWIYDNQVDVGAGRDVIALEAAAYRTPQLQINAFLLNLEKRLL
jgi:hypothetical protein